MKHSQRKRMLINQLNSNGILQNKYSELTSTSSNRKRWRIRKQSVMKNHVDTIVTNVQKSGIQNEIIDWQEIVKKQISMIDQIKKKNKDLK